MRWLISIWALLCLPRIDESTPFENLGRRCSFNPISPKLTTTWKRRSSKRGPVRIEDRLATRRHALGEFDAVLDRAVDEAEAFNRAARLARQCDHKTATHERGHVARQDCVRGDLHALRAHYFAEAGQFLGHDLAHRLRSYVAWRYACAARGEDQPAAGLFKLTDLGLDRALFVRNKPLGQPLPAILRSRFLQSRSAEIVVFATRGSVADG